MSDIKLCKDCKWVKDPGRFAECTKPRTHDLVTGQPIVGDMRYCSIQREADWLWRRVAPFGRCGEVGAWWEPK